jgi:hypothetical protein
MTKEGGATGIRQPAASTPTDLTEIAFKFSSPQDITSATFNSNGYETLLFGITADEVGGLPEPSTWAMMILGFFGLGFLGYRRKNGTLRIA